MTKHSPQRIELRDALRMSAVAFKRADIPFVLTGGYAAWIRGAVEPEHDVDFVIHEGDVERAKKALSEAGLTVKIPGEDWLFKAYHGDSLIDVLYKINGEPVTPETLADSEILEVCAVRMPVLNATDILAMKMRAYGPHHCDYAPLLGRARAMREQVNWERLRDETSASPYAQAFLMLLHSLRISPVGPRVNID